MDIGTMIAGRYRVDAPLGTGGVATVFRGTDLTLQRPVAVKVLRPELASDPESVERFRREAYNAAKLNHPHIVQIHDTGVEKGDYYIVMEYLGQPDLKKILQEYAPLPLRKVVEVATVCCRALAYAHRQGIVHRDVKPQNILFTDDGVAKLSDFGIAAAAGTPGLTPSGMVLGTAHYISPEQAQGHPVGPHSDIYSLGCIMYECLTGRTPFEGTDAAQVAAEHVRERPVAIRSLNPNVSPSAEFVVNKAMSRDVARRYRTAEEMLGDLEKLAEGVALDRTGTLGQAEGATLALNATPAPSVAPAQPRVATPTAGPYAQPYATQRPLRQRQQQPNTGPLVAGLIIALLVAIVAVGGAAWLVKKAFYPGEPPKTVQVPAVKGHSEAEARKAIEAAGLRVGAITYQYNDLAPQGTVLEQGPAMGETVPPGSEVALVINRGKEQVAVTNLVNETLDRAKRKLEQSGLTLGNVTENFSNTVPVGTVIKQEIAPGTKVEKGQPVDLVVSKGPEVLNPVTPPGGTVEPGTEVTEQDPDVSVTEDKTYAPPNPAKRRFVVRVTAQGKQPGQQIEIVKRDDAGGRIVVKSVRMDPGNTQEVPVNATGNVTIEVLLDKKSVFQQRIPAESAGKKSPQ